MRTGRFAAANVVALASKLFPDVSISGDCAIPGGACSPPLIPSGPLLDPGKFEF